MLEPFSGTASRRSRAGKAVLAGQWNLKASRFPDCGTDRCRKTLRRLSQGHAVAAFAVEAFPPYPDKLI
jgi:hypothetical protein